MPRGGGGGGGRAGVGGRVAPARSAPARSAPRAPSSQPVPAQGSSGGSMLGAIVDGFGWSTGASIAQRAVDAVVGPRTIRHETVASEVGPPTIQADDACSVHSKLFQDCLNDYGDQISVCQSFMDKLVQCKRNSR